MGRRQSASLFLADLHARVAAHERYVEESVLPLSPVQMAWRPAPGEWSILHCLDHLNQTHVYYQTKLDVALYDPTPAPSQDSLYAPSGWARIYMAFAFNPRFSFPTPTVLAPQTEPPADAPARFLMKLAELRARLDQVATVDLIRTRVPVEKGIRFNVGDCLHILVYHDALHLRQASRVAVAYRAGAR